MNIFKKDTRIVKYDKKTCKKQPDMIRDYFTNLIKTEEINLKNLKTKQPTLNTITLNLYPDNSIAAKRGYNYYTKVGEKNDTELNLDIDLLKKCINYQETENLSNCKQEMDDISKSKRRLDQLKKEYEDFKDII